MSNFTKTFRIGLFTGQGVDHTVGVPLCSDFLETLEKVVPNAKLTWGTLNNGDKNGMQFLQLEYSRDESVGQEVFNGECQKITACLEKKFGLTKNLQQQIETCHDALFEIAKT